jgi:PIN domain nuclease of toxin-antitoxin system
VAFLLDTVAFIFAAKAPERLTKRVADIFANPETDLLLSSISLSEIAIKNAVGKIQFPLHDVKRGLEDLRVRLLHYTAMHAFRLFDLSVRHNDPFDRQIIAQALSEKIPIITSDKEFRLYDDLEVIW